MHTLLSYLIWSDRYRSDVCWSILLTHHNLPSTGLLKKYLIKTIHTHLSGTLLPQAVPVHSDSETSDSDDESGEECILGVIQNEFSSESEGSESDNQDESDGSDY